ncbi:MAG TPA: hypothetical protein VK510_01920, partial [Solirubrobacteraceae bacterium]|nr:hypothetical protein [Solirubrobacteraceae bacterium]
HPHRRLRPPLRAGHECALEREGHAGSDPQGQQERTARRDAGPDARGYYAAVDPGLGPVGRYFDGEATSEVGLSAGVRRDIWTAVQPDIGALQRMIDGLDRRFPLATGRSQGLLLAALAARYEVAPPPASFRLIVSPLVEWIWLGGAIAGFGGLIALWPAAAKARRPATVLSRMRLRRQPSHA